MEGEDGEAERKLVILKGLECRMHALFSSLPCHPTSLSFPSPFTPSPFPSSSLQCPFQQVSLSSHIASSSQGAALVAAILQGDAQLLGAALGESNGSVRDTGRKQRRLGLYTTLDNASSQQSLAATLFEHLCQLASRLFHPQQTHFNLTLFPLPLLSL